MVKRNSGAYTLLNKINASTSDEALKQCQADFDAKKVPMFYKSLSDESIEIGCPDTFAMVREDTEAYLGSVGDKYEKVQYKKIFDFTEVLVSEGDASYVGGRLIGNGQQVFLVMRTADYVSFNQDQVDCFFYVASSHDGTIALDVMPTPVVQSSGCILTMPTLRGMKMKHTKTIHDRMATARASLGKVRSYWDEFTDSFKLMAGTKLTNDEAEGYFEQLITGESTRAENIRDRIKTIYTASSVNQIAATRGTMLGAYFAFVQYCDTEMIVKKSKKLDQVSSTMCSALTGNGARKKAEAYSTAKTLMSKFGHLKAV
jgi:phage/plasmid-like protein (TIGR03299 family)